MPGAIRQAALVCTLALQALSASPPLLARQTPPAAAAARDTAARPALSPQNASYSIDVRLDPARRLVTGREVITWRNITAVAAAELRLHLYWNAWKNTRSTWLREAALAGRESGLDERPADDFSWSEVTAVRLLGVGAAPPIDLTRRVAAIAPDDGNTDDQTLIAVPLPSPVPPGAAINVEVEWSARVPRPFSRTGVVGQFYFLAHWFPKIGVLGDDGWRARQFHHSTEFFADYGVYDVRLRVPTGWVVGATGLEQSRRDNGDGTTTHRYVERDVHDFAWTTSPDLVVHTERFEHPGLPPVDMRLLLQPEHAGQARRHFDATRAALRYYGEWFGAYPYGHVTIVDPAWQSDAGGMEYPTLFTAGTDWLPPRGVADPEGVTVHEAGHQFWYGMVGNNEFEHAWLDEGLNSFAEARVIAQIFKPDHHRERFFGRHLPWVYRDIALSRETDLNGLRSYADRAEADVPSTPSWRYFPSSGGAISYSKTALWLNTLERMLGWPTLQRAMSTFFDRWKFRHPGPDDFFAVVNEVSGRDLTWFFDQVYRSSNTFDYGVASLESRERKVRGYVDGGGARVFADRALQGERFETQVVVRRHGEAVFPVDVLVTFEDGRDLRQRWDGRDRWKALTFRGPSKAVSATVDPDRVLLLDIDRTNNSAAAEPDAEVAAQRWTLRWMVWLQDVLMTYAFFV